MGRFRSRQKIFRIGLLDISSGEWNSAGSSGFPEKPGQPPKAERIFPLSSWDRDPGQKKFSNDKKDGAACYFLHLFLCDYTESKFQKRKNSVYIQFNGR